MKNLEKYLSLLSGEVDGLLLTSRYSRHYGAEFDIAEGVAIVTKAGCRYFTDSRYIEAAQKGISGFEVLEVNANAGYIQRLNDAIAEVKGEKVKRAAACTVDIQIEAYIPEEYIESTASRIDMYRKIATVRDEDDKWELADELCDRYGEPPKAIMGLITVSMLRNTAANMGITEITQRSGSLQFYIEAPEPEQIAALSQKYGRRILFSCMEKPFIGVKLLPDQQPALLMQEVIYCMRDAKKA